MEVARRGNTITFELSDRVFTCKLEEVIELYDKLTKLITTADRKKALDKK